MPHQHLFYLFSLASADLPLESWLDDNQPFFNSPRCEIHMVFETKLYGTHLDALQFPNRSTTILGPSSKNSSSWSSWIPQLWSHLYLWWSSRPHTLLQSLCHEENSRSTHLGHFYSSQNLILLKVSFSFAFHAHGDCLSQYRALFSFSAHSSFRLFTNPLVGWHLSPP